MLASSVDLSTSPEHPYVPALLALLPAGPEVTRLREVAARRLVIAHELDAIAEDLQVERAALDERRSALDSLHGITSGGAIRARLASAVEAGVGRLDTLTGRSASLRAEQVAVGEEWYGVLRALAASR